MATSPLVSPPPNPAALATGLPDNRVLAGTSAAPPRPSRFINVRRPSRPFELVTDVCDFAVSAPFRAEPSWIGVSCVFIGFVFTFGFSFFYTVGLTNLQSGVDRAVFCQTLSVTPPDCPWRKIFPGMEKYFAQFSTAI